MIETFVTIHDQDLVLGCEASGQFAGVSHTYLFVGPRPVDRLPEGLKVVVARDHQPNFEQWPHFYDFTGWWAAAHHGRIHADQIICIQYDMLIAEPDIEQRCAELLSIPGPVAFTAGHRLAHNWMLLIDGFDQTFRNGLAHLDPPVADMSTWIETFNEWPSTQGTAWRTDEFVDFMEWVTPLFPLWADNVWAGHLMERMVKAWTMLTGHPEKYLPGAIHHQHFDCHGTCALMAGQTTVHAERAATFGVLSPA